MTQRTRTQTNSQNTRMSSSRCRARRERCDSLLAPFLAVLRASRASVTIPLTFETLNLHVSSSLIPLLLRRSIFLHTD